MLFRHCFINCTLKTPFHDLELIRSPHISCHRDHHCGLNNIPIMELEPNHELVPLAKVLLSFLNLIIPFLWGFLPPGKDCVWNGHWVLGEKCWRENALVSDNYFIKEACANSLRVSVCFTRRQLYGTNRTARLLGGI